MPEARLQITLILMLVTFLAFDVLHLNTNVRQMHAMFFVVDQVAQCITDLAVLSSHVIFCYSICNSVPTNPVFYSAELYLSHAPTLVP